MSGERTPRPWPADTTPTADQLASFLAICSHTERVAYVVAARVAMQDQHDCWVQAHARRVDEGHQATRRIVAALDYLDSTSSRGEFASPSEVRRLLLAVQP